MPSQVNIVLTVSGSGTDMSRLAKGDSQTTLNEIQDLFASLACGAEWGKMDLYYNTVQASGTLTMNTVVNGNTCAVAGVTFTSVASNPTSVQFVTGGTNAATATNLAAAINANTTTNKVVTATASGAVVTVTAQVPGTEGNLIALATGGATIAISGALLTGGSDGTKASYSFGIA